MAQIGIVVTLDYTGCMYWPAIHQYELGFGVQHSLAMPDSCKLKRPALMKEIMQDLVIQYKAVYTNMLSHSCHSHHRVYPILLMKCLIKNYIIWMVTLVRLLRNWNVT